MVITWLGLSAFEIETKQMENEVRLVVDPYQNETGLRFPRTLAAQLVLSSRDHEDQNNVEAVEGNGEKPFIVDGPGEYEINGVFVYGIEAPRLGKKEGSKEAHTIWRIETEGMSLAHLGAMNRELTSDELGQLPSIDILMIPVGGNDVMTQKMAMSTIEKIEPRIVIPMYYGLPGVKQELADLAIFLREHAGAKTEELPKLKIKKADLPPEDMLTKILTRA
jgi:L-ascorbate metabolism protein UlaG (beta-lactamase superfamily)